MDHEELRNLEDGDYVSFKLYDWWFEGTVVDILIDDNTVTDVYVNCAHGQSRDGAPYRGGEEIYVYNDELDFLQLGPGKFYKPGIDENIQITHFF